MYPPKSQYAHYCGVLSVIPSLNLQLFVYRVLIKMSNLTLLIRSAGKLQRSACQLQKSFSTSSFCKSGDFRPEGCQSGRFTDIGTRRIFTSEHDMFREVCRKFYQEEVVPFHGEWEEAGQVSRELWLKAGERGLLGTNTGEEFGGIGGDWLSAAIVHEEQGYSNCSGPGFALHSDIVMPYLTKYGTPDQIAKYIPAMTAGKKIGAIAMTEPGAGSDLQV